MSRISPGVLSQPREVLTPDEWRARGRAWRERAWDLGHMATPDLRVSFAVAARGNGLKEGAGYAAARRCASSDRAEMARFASMRFLNVRCSRIDAAQVSQYYDALQPKKAVQRRHKEIGKAQRRTSQKAMTKCCEQVDEEYRIRPDHPVIVRFPIERNPEMDIPAMNRDQPTSYAELVRWAVARGHARTGQARLLSGYLSSDGEFDSAIAQSSVTCTEQNENDYYALVDAVATGRTQAVTGLLAANQRPRLTGPLLPCARVRPGTAAAACYRWTSTAPTPRLTEPASTS